MKILVIEDEKKVATQIKKGLLLQDFKVDIAYDGYTGERLAVQNTYDVIILDIIIPDINGILLCQKLKSIKPEIYIIILSALGTGDDRVAGLEAGADDYLVKPFEFKELVARIKLFKRKGVKIKSEELNIADLQVDLERKTVLRGADKIQLSSKEFSLLLFLIRNKGKVLSRNEILTEVWGMDFDSGTNVVDVYINFLRKKIDSGYSTKLIQTRVGFGYFIDDTK